MPRSTQAATCTSPGRPSRATSRRPPARSIGSATTCQDELSCTNHPDAFALELSADGARLLASTYVGGAGYDYGQGIAVDEAGRTYVAGRSSSPRGFPIVDAFQATINDSHAWCAARADCSDAFLVRLDPGKTRVEYGTFHGGLSQDEARGVTLAGGDAWIAGVTHSPNLATTAGAARWSGGNCSFLRGSLDSRPARTPSSRASMRHGRHRRPARSRRPPTDGAGAGATPGGGTGGSGTDPGGTGTLRARPSRRREPGTATARRVERTLTMRRRGRHLSGRVAARHPRVRAPSPRAPRAPAPRPLAAHPLRAHPHEPALHVHASAGPRSTAPPPPGDHAHPRRATVRCVLVKRRIRRAR